MKAYKFKLDEDYTYKHGLFEGVEFISEWASIAGGQITIRKGYAWDGCSPKRTFTGLFAFGTPDGVLRHGKPWTYHASLVHDVLCQYRGQYNGQHGLSQLQVVWIFGDMLKEVNWPLTKLYVWAVSRLGPQDF